MGHKSYTPIFSCLDILYSYFFVFGLVLKLVFNFFLMLYNMHFFLRWYNSSLRSITYLSGWCMILYFCIVGHYADNRPFSQISNSMISHSKYPTYIHISHAIMHTKEFSNDILKGYQYFCNLLFNVKDGNALQCLTPGHLKQVICRILGTVH